MPEFVKLEGTLPKGAEDELAACLSPMNVLGVQLEPDTPDRVRVGVWIAAGNDRLDAGVRSLLHELGSEAVKRRLQDDEDWASRWRNGLCPFPVGDTWWIDPRPGRPTAAPDGRLRLAVEPRSAFGSGTHESTRLVLMELEKIECRRRDVLDLGAGSGILAVAADCLAARRVVAVDTDPIAAWETLQTARVQDWSCRPHIIAGGVECLEGVEFDMVLCNMITTEFAPLLGVIRMLLRPGGSAIISGMIASERTFVEKMLAEVGLAGVGWRALDGWISIRATRIEVEP
jgi:ribosomal protein L11 methyltransferase